MMYDGDDRVQQINWLEQEAVDIAFYGEGSGEELVSFWESQGNEKPDWFDDHDRGLLVGYLEAQK